MADSTIIPPGTTIDFTRDGNEITVSFGDVASLVFQDGATLLRLSTLADMARDSIKMAPRKPMIHSRL